MLALAFAISLPVWLIVEELMRLRSDKMPKRVKAQKPRTVRRPQESVLARSA